MTLCPDCKKQELQGDEEHCPRCANKQTSFLVKVGQVGLGVVVVGLLAFFGGKKGNSA